MAVGCTDLLSANMKMIIAWTVVTIVVGFCGLLLMIAAIERIRTWRQWWEEALYFLLFIAAIALVIWAFMTVSST